MGPPPPEKVAQLMAADEDLMLQMRRKWGDVRATILSEFANFWNAAGYAHKELRPVFENMLHAVCEEFGLPRGNRERVLPGDSRDYFRDCVQVADGRRIAMDGPGDVHFLSPEQCADMKDPSKLN